MNKKILCFDMDGTIADFYNVENWLFTLNGKKYHTVRNRSTYV